jgi:tetratricopeptide (TPR) repeat protein/SAM-dependent methyltransferase
MDYSQFKPGDDNYRAYIGPPLQYDFMGATQFRLLCTLGLRAYHKVLDLGCGSLRAGRFLINYLESDNYYAIEPNKWLIDDAINEQLGSSIIDIKKPKFDHNSDFNTQVFNTQFDFIIAQSIFSHTGEDLIKIAFNNIQRSLTDDGIALVTFIKGEQNFAGNGWIYPDCVEFTESTILTFIEACGLHVKELPWFHPRQTWFVVSKKYDDLPKENELYFLTGTVLRSPEFKQSVTPFIPTPPLLIKKPKVLVCTGFHRSATSATANYLYNAGLSLGHNLMPGGISNPNGHFEDLDVVKLHDEQLALSSSSWQFHDECHIDPSNGFLDDYIKLRNSADTAWGVKDPRACIFLDEWQSALGEQGHFLFVARHWSSCIESLLHRHSREFAYGLPTLQLDNIGIKFWQLPELAAEMWLSYNRKLLVFAKQNPANTLIVTQRALFEGAPIISTLNDKFGFSLDATVPSPFDPKLFRDKASEGIFSQLSKSLQRQLNQLWQELLMIAEFKSNHEDPIIEPQPDWLAPAVEDVYQAMGKSVFAERKPMVAVNTAWLDNVVQVTDTKGIIDLIDKATVSQLAGIDNDEWLTIIDNRYSLDGEVHLSAAKLLFRLQDYSSAITYFQQSITLGIYFPFVDMMIAQCFEHMILFDKAEFFFKKAIKANPNNPNFYTNYAKMLLKIEQMELAEQQYKLGLEKGPKQVACVIAYSDFLDNTNRTDEAIALLSELELDNKSAIITNTLVRYKLKQDVNSGTLLYLDMVKSQLADKNTQQWLIECCGLLHSCSAEKDFISRCLVHWNKLN